MLASQKLLAIARPLRLALAALAIALGGCSQPPPLGSVTGVVTIDGQPLKNVLVTFTPEASGDHAQVRSMGLSDDAGRFALRTETQRDGALAGEHRITVEDMAIYDAPRSEDGTILAMPPVRFPAVYADALHTPLHATVRQNASQTIAVELVSRP